VRLTKWHGFQCLDLIKTKRDRWYYDNRQSRLKSRTHLIDETLAGASRQTDEERRIRWRCQRLPSGFPLSLGPPSGLPEAGFQPSFAWHRVVIEHAVRCRDIDALWCLRFQPTWPKRRGFDSAIDGSTKAHGNEVRLNVGRYAFHHKGLAWPKVTYALAKQYGLVQSKFLAFEGSSQTEHCVLESPRVVGRSKIRRGYLPVPDEALKEQ